MFFEYNNLYKIKNMNKIMGIKQKTITGWLTQDLVPVFKSRIYNNNLDMEQDPRSKELRIYPMPRIRKSGYYPYCGVLKPSGLTLTYLNLKEFEEYHKTLEDIFKEVLGLRKK